MRGWRGWRGPDRVAATLKDLRRNAKSKAALKQMACLNDLVSYLLSTGKRPISKAALDYWCAQSKKSRWLWSHEQGSTLRLKMLPRAMILEINEICR